MSDGTLLVGFGQANQAVARALIKRGRAVVATDDGDRPDLAATAEGIGVDLVQQPSAAQLDDLVRNAAVIVPTPGLPHHHPAMVDLAPERMSSEFDLAQSWDSRPVITVTGTDGKTTVTTMVTEMFKAAGRNVVDAGNNDLPLVAAIDDPLIEIFIVEASSFRLGHSRTFSPAVGTWLNFGPDHLDVHGSLQDYEAAKASLWTRQSSTDTAIGNIDDQVVARNLGAATARQVGFSIRDEQPGSAADYRVIDGVLTGPDGALIDAAELPRSLPHDIANALAASATALAGGVDVDAVRQVLKTFTGLPHRMALIGRTANDITWFNDSKATTPHAVLAAVSGFESVVLIAGGRNKDLDLGPLVDAVPHLRAVVAIGDAAGEVAAVFDGHVPVTQADSMEAAIDAANDRAVAGDSVVLSPSCTSFDWYRNYAERGDVFTALVNERISLESS